MSTWRDHCQQQRRRESGGARTRVLEFGHGGDADRDERVYGGGMGRVVLPGGDERAGLPDLLRDAIQDRKCDRS